MSHTPGPWKEEYREQSLAVYQRTVSGKKTGRPICVVSRKDKANARLIAVAPEMLTRLKTIHAGMNCICKFLPSVGKEAPCEVCQIEDLIAKAEGRS